jgi:short-subunit dehydrogenase
MSADKPEVVVITGASAGIGRETARLFGKNGARVGLLARNLDGLNAAKKEIEDLGGQAIVCQTDVAYPDQIEAAANKVEEAFGPIDIWINNAMAAVFSPVTEMTPEEYKRVTEVTYLGQVYGAQAALKRMLPREKGTIVFVGSALAYRGIPLQSSYCGAKHAVQGFFDSLRTELLHNRSNVHVTMVQLPGVNSTQFDLVRNKMPHKTKPIGAIYQPEVAAEALYWAAHNKRRELIVGYPAVQAIMGNKFAPQYADHVLAEIGFREQQTDLLEDPNRPDYLFETVPGDHGVHGRFDDVAKDFSPQLYATTHRTQVALGLVSAVLGLWWLTHRKAEEDKMRSKVSLR